MKKSRIIIGVVVLIAIAGFAYLINYNNSFRRVFRFSPIRSGTTYKTPEEESNIFVRFDMEAYDKIQENLWEKSPDENLAELFRLSLAKAASTSPESVTLPTKDRAGVVKILSAAFSNLNDDEKKKLALNTLIVATFNLRPNSRNGLMNLKEETALRENVSNIDRNKDLYQDLGVQKGANTDEIKQAYEKKKQDLTAKNTPEAAQELEKIAYAQKVLTDENTKTLYDQNQIEPTVLPAQSEKLFIFISIKSLQRRFRNSARL